MLGSKAKCRGCNEKTEKKQRIEGVKNSRLIGVSVKHATIQFET